MPCGRTVNSDHYIHILKILQKRFRGGRTQNVAGLFLQHDNARAHTSFKILEVTTKLAWAVLSHPPHDPNLAPLDFYLFGTLKDGKVLGLIIGLVKK